MIEIRRFRPDEPRYLAAMSRGRAGSSEVDRVAAEIVASVRERGDVALFEHMRRLDGVDLLEQAVRVSDPEFEAVREAVPDGYAEALRQACVNVRAFHEAQRPESYTFSPAGGGLLTRRYMAVQSVGVTVPSGVAPLASSLYMNVIPAQVAGVERISVIAAPRQGRIHPLLLFTAAELGVRDVYKVSGAQGIAALAYGTESVPAVDKIVGPGNAYVQAAKRQVSGHVGIDSFAGPSEIVIVADERTPGAFIAADLAAQAEHGTGEELVLAFVTSERQAHAITGELERLVAEQGVTNARAALERLGTIFVVDSLDEAIDATNAIAPEHAQVACEGADELASRIVTAGAVFVGPYTAEALGDYYCGANHVLPTGRTSRFTSGLTVGEFMRGATYVRYDREAIRRASGSVGVLAEAEGMHAHALSARVRAR